MSTLLTPSLGPSVFRSRRATEVAVRSKDTLSGSESKTLVEVLFRENTLLQTHGCYYNKI